MRINAQLRNNAPFFLMEPADECPDAGSAEECPTRRYISNLSIFLLGPILPFFQSIITQERDQMFKILWWQ